MWVRRSTRLLWTKVPPHAEDGLDYTTASDLTLFLRWRDHDDETAFFSLVNRHEPRLLAYALNRLRNNPAAAPDAVQHTWQRLITRFCPDPQYQNLLPWLIIVLERRCVDILRGGGRDRLLATTLPDEPVPSPQQRMDEQWEEEDARERLLRCMEHLPPELQAVVRLRLWDGLRVVDAARELEISQGEVSSRYHEALRRLRRCLQDEA
jgi:RNA polymerase sigma factor (sigma-70 family)